MKTLGLALIVVLLTGCTFSVDNYRWTGGDPLTLQAHSSQCVHEANSAVIVVPWWLMWIEGPRRTLYKDCMEKAGYVKVGKMATDDGLPETFYQGQNFLGNPTQISLTGQEQGPSSILAAGGAPATSPVSQVSQVSPVSASKSASASVSGAAGGQGGGLDPLGIGLNAAGKIESLIQNLLKGGGGGGDGENPVPDPGAGGTAQGTGSAADIANEAVASGASESSTADAILGGTTAPIAESAGISLLDAYGVASAVYELGKMGFQMGLGGGEGPTSGNQYMDMAMGLLGPVGDVIGGFSRGAFTPSENWMSFSRRLAPELGNEAQNLQSLVGAVGRAQNRGDLAQATDLFQQSMRTGDSAYTNPTGDIPQIGGIPGATGTAHEGGVRANFDPQVEAINNYIRAMHGVLPAGKATPMSLSSFDWGTDDATLASAQSAIKGMLAGQQVDVSGFTPAMRQRINDTVQANWPQPAFYTTDPSGVGGGDGAGAP